VERTSLISPIAGGLFILGPLVMQPDSVNVAAPLLSAPWLLLVYCLLVTATSLAGGWLLLLIHLNHTRLQMAVSFVAGLMLGIALLHFLPDACEQLGSLAARGIPEHVFCPAVFPFSPSRFAGGRPGRLLRP
jgi:zinc transporter ZupT